MTAAGAELEATRRAEEPSPAPAVRLSGVSRSVLRRAKGIKLLLLDVDGILTDGRLIFDATGEAQMAFHVRDGHGMKLAQHCGLALAIITGRESPMVARRAQELGIVEVHQKAVDKLPVFQGLLEQRGLAPAEAACMGDDLLDLPLMLRAGLAITVPDAAEEVRRAAQYVTRCAGGQGAVREAIELLLKAQGHWPRLLERYWR
jgi:3-deoxy-D-manno-octulosonate 8-phosphate phosphatase (KDO 8-P phosphatase)